MKFIDLFAGIGGFRIAAESLGLKCVFTSEIEPNAIKVYKENFGFTRPLDITQFPLDIVPKHDILLGGFPCQAFSISGKRQGFKENRGVLFFYILEILRLKRPRMFLLENVKGIISHDKGSTVKVIKRELRAIGYHIHTKVLNSKDFGVPQNRERWYCVGFRGNLPESDCFQFPKPTGKKTLIKDILEDNPKGCGLGPAYKRILELFLKNPKKIIPIKTVRINSLRSNGIMGKMQSNNILRFKTMNGYYHDQNSGFYSKESVSDTLMTGTCPKLWDLKRFLSPRELLRLQGFPDSFKFNVSRNTAKILTGNSVTVPVIRAIMKKMLIAIQY